jgi:plastocyanin
MKHTRTAVASAIAVATVLLPATSAHAVIAAAVPQSFQFGYATPVVVTPVGGPVTFVNTDTIPHNLQADGVFLPKKKAKKAEWCDLFPTKKCPLFYSDAVGTGQAAQVEGLENLKSGEQYPFFCVLHPSMKGTLYAF